MVEPIQLNWVSIKYFVWLITLFVCSAKLMQALFGFISPLRWRVRSAQDRCWAESELAVLLPRLQVNTPVDGPLENGICVLHWNRSSADTLAPRTAQANCSPHINMTLIKDLRRSLSYYECNRPCKLIKVYHEATQGSPTSQVKVLL